MDDASLVSLLHGAADAVRRALDELDDWGLAGTRPGQYHSDLTADRAAVDLLTAAGLGVLSEESGDHHDDRALVVVVDPLDGSTNASRHLPWFATSLCVVDRQGPRIAVVANQATGTRYEAVRGGGARRDGHPLRPSTCVDVGRALIGLNGYPRRHLGWKQARMLGAAALDLCAVADGSLDGYVDCTRRSLAPWDYLGGLLVCQEAGAVVADAFGEDLVTRDGRERRTPVAAATPELLGGLLAARTSTG